MFKKLVHYITSKRLEKHRLKTQCMIDEYERRAAASNARVQAQADKYTSEIERMAEQRHEQIADYMAGRTEMLRTFMPIRFCSGIFSKLCLPVLKAG